MQDVSVKPQDASIKDQVKEYDDDSPKTETYPPPTVPQQSILKILDIEQVNPLDYFPYI